MAKLFLIFLVVAAWSCSKSNVPQIITQRYHFIATDGVQTTLEQVNDTLFLHESGPVTTYKLAGCRKSGIFTVLEVAHDLMPCREPSARHYSLLILRDINTKTLGWRPLIFDWPRSRIDTVNLDPMGLDNLSFLTFYSESYVQELAKLKRLSTWADATAVLQAIKGNDVAQMQIAYTAEEFNAACIKMGYNPAGAGLMVESLLLQRQMTSQSRPPAHAKP